MVGPTNPHADTEPCNFMYAHKNLSEKQNLVSLQEKIGTSWMLFNKDVLNKPNIFPENSLKISGHMGLSQGSIGMGQPSMGQQLGGQQLGGPSQAGSFPQLGVGVAESSENALKSTKPPDFWSS